MSNSNKKLLITRESIINKIEKIVDSSNSNELEILENIIHNKLEKLLEQSVLKEQAKQLFEDTIIKITTDFLKKYDNTFWYNKHNDTYYIYNDDTLEIINSDSIIIKINNYIPEQYYKYKINFQKHLLSEIQNRNMFIDIRLSKKTTERIISLINPILENIDNVKYVLLFIGYSILTNLKSDNNESFNKLYDNCINLWFGGQVVNDFLEAIKYWINKLLKVYPKLLTTIKTSYNNYNFSKLHIVKFNNLDNTQNDMFFSELKKHRLELLITSIKFYQEYKNTNFKQIYYINNFSKTDLFKMYTDSMIELSEYGIIKVKDILTSFTKFLYDKNLPDNLLTQNEIKEYMDDLFVSYIDTKNSNIYRKITLKDYNIYDIVFTFCDNNIINDNNGNTKLNDIYFFFKKWYNYNYTNTASVVRNDIKEILDTLYTWDGNLQLYKDISILSFNKSEIFDFFCEENIEVISIESTLYDKFNIKIEELFTVFMAWYKYNYIDYPLISKEELKDLMNQNYGNNYKKYKGWVNMKLINKNCFNITDHDKQEIIENLKFSSSV